jgi:heme oxygenase
MKKLLILLVFLTGLSACSNAGMDHDDVADVPKNLLDKEEFTNMLTDSYLIEAAIRQGVGKGQKAEELSKYYYPRLFEKYHITEEDFKENIKYYASQPELMQEIQTDMVNRLSVKEEELTNQ